MVNWIERSSTWKVGDWAVYRKSKHSAVPGRRAAGVMASCKGEVYAYVVDKFWVVEEIIEGGKLRMRTARGKRHIIDRNDPNLRPAGWLERLRYRERFLAVTDGQVCD